MSDEGSVTNTVFSVGLVLLLISAVCSAKIIGRDEALRAIFPGASISSTVVFLTDAEVKQIADAAGVPVTTALVAKYVATKGGKEAGRAYLDTHVVRTKKESLLVILNPDGSVKRVETVAFLEPPEYLAPDRWYREFDEKKLNDNLRVARDIHPVTGATLTAKAVTDAVRRVLATDQLLQKKEAKKMEHNP